MIQMESCSSTNDEAEKLARKGAPEGTVVFSREQTRGRGRKERRWVSYKGKGLYMSVLLRPPHAEVQLLSILAGIAVCDAVYDLTGVRLQIKWPNDLIWEQKKVGGILIEGTFLGDCLSYAVLGIGMNMAHREKDFPENIRKRSVSLRMITKKMIESEALLKKICSSLNDRYKMFLEEDYKTILSSFLNHSVFPPGAAIKVRSDKRSITGIFKGIDQQGRLLIDNGDRMQSIVEGRISAVE